MRRVPSHPIHLLAACAALLLATTALAACGGDEETQALEFKVNVKGKNGTAVTAPESAEAGLAKVTYGNNTAGAADLQLIRVEGDHTPREVAVALTEATEGRPYPDWFFAAGGVGLIQPGENVTARQVLQPGTYYAFNTEDRLDPQTTPSFEVTGDASDEELPNGKVTVEASEYAFKTKEPLPSGINEIRFDNVGKQPHHMLAAKLIGDATVEEVERYFRTQKGKSQLSVPSIQTTAVVEGGESQLVTFDLEPGRYAFYCFITDREGGKPHVLEGMVDEFEVK